jgi:hypothetical protein
MREMNKKMVMGALVGAFLLLASIGAVASATSVFEDPEDDMPVEYDEIMNGDRLQSRDQLRNGTCEECDGNCYEGSNDGNRTMHQHMLGQLEQQRSGEDRAGQVNRCMNEDR